MQFPTLEFALVFTITASISWLIRRQRNYQKLWLLTVSYYVYAGWNWQVLGLIVLSSIFNYFVGEQLASAGAASRRKLWLAVCLAGNLGLLGTFKYYNFFSESFGDLLAMLGLESHLPVLQLILPIGISFYTFQSIAYCVDLYRGYGLKAANLLDFLLFTAFFPQLVAGPICRSRDLLPQFMGPAPDKVPDLDRAAALILSGLFKKAVLATFIDTHCVFDVFGAPDNYSAMALWVGMLAYTIQIYADFSGYTDLARGLGLLLGFHIPENFNHPYAATNIGDYWRRWHITFSSWLRDYIYFPLGGSRQGMLRTYLNLFITMLVCGLWHGADWRFIIWGAIHGIALAGYRIGRDIKRWRGLGLDLPQAKWHLALSWLYTFSVCCLSRIFFRSADIPRAWTYLTRMLSPQAPGQGFEALLLLAILLGLLMNFYGTQMRAAFTSTLGRVPLAVRPLAWLAVGLLLLAIKPTGIAPYIYFKF